MFTATADLVVDFGMTAQPCWRPHLNKTYRLTQETCVSTVVMSRSLRFCIAVSDSS